MTIPLTLRLEKGAPLTNYELDQNFIELRDAGAATAALQTNITNEATSRASADTTLQTNITAEATARAAADALKAPLASPTFTGTLGATAAHMTTPGVFTGTQMSTPFQVLTGGINPQTEYQFSHTGKVTALGFVTGVAVPASSTIYEVDGLASYVSNASTTTGVAAGSFYARPTAAGATVWALNPLVTDGDTSGSVAGTVVGAEWDIGAFNTGSTAIGQNVIGVFPNGTPVSATAIQVTALNAPWQFAFVSFDGSSQNAMLVGAQGTTPNSNGQPIVFDVRDASNTVRQCTLQAGPSGSSANLNLIFSAGGGLIIEGNLLTSGNTTLQGNMEVDGIANFKSIVQLKPYTVALLPSAAGVGVGSIAFTTDGRNTGEAASAGTGCMVQVQSKSGTPTWCAVWSGVAVAA